MREVGMPLFRMLVSGYFIDFAIYIAGSVILGMGMSTLIEMRALKLRDRLFPSLSRPLTPPARAADEQDPRPAPAPRAAPITSMSRYR
jgi:hypothetical protein